MRKKSLWLLIIVIVGIISFRLFLGLFVGGFNFLANRHNFRLNNSERTYRKDEVKEYYKAEWADEVIDSSGKDLSQIKSIEIDPELAELIVYSDDVENISYKISGLPEKYVTVKISGSTIKLAQKAFVERGKYKRSWFNANISMELIIPKNMELENFNANTSRNSTKIKGITCKDFAVNTGISSTEIQDIKCKDFKLSTSTAKTILKNIRCDFCEIDTSTGKTEIEDLIAKKNADIDASTGTLIIKKAQLKNPDLDLCGYFEYDGTVEGDVLINGGINKTYFDFNNSEKINDFEFHASTGRVTMENFSCEDLEIELSTGRSNFENIKANSTKIETSTAKSEFRNCVFKDLDLDLSTASFYFSGLLKGECEIRPSTAKSIFEIKDSKENYFVKVHDDDDSDDFVIESDSQNSYGNKNAKNIIHVYKTSGKFRMSFDY